MGRNASVATAAVLNALPDDGGPGAAPTLEGGGIAGGTTAGGGGKPSSIANILNRITEMFKDPAAHMSYLNSAKVRQGHSQVKLEGPPNPRV